MKIGIVTYVKCDNYGAELQAYALQKKLNDWGYNAEVLDLEKQKKNLVSSRVVRKAIINRYRQFGLFEGTKAVFRLILDKYAVYQTGIIRWLIFITWICLMTLILLEVIKYGITCKLTIWTFIS